MFISKNDCQQNRQTFGKCLCSKATCFIKKHVRFVDHVCTTWIDKTILYLSKYFISGCERSKEPDDPDLHLTKPMNLEDDYFAT